MRHDPLPQPRHRGVRALRDLLAAAHLQVAPDDDDLLGRALLFFLFHERLPGFEPGTPTMARWCSQPLSYNRMSPSPVPIRATRPYRGPADAGPKGVSWGSAIRTRTNSFFRLSGCLLPHSPLGPGAPCARQDLNPALSCVRKARFERASREV